MPDLSSPQAEEGLRTAPARLMSGSRRSKTGVLRRAALRPVRRIRGPRARGRLRVPGITGAAFGPASDSPETGSSCVRAFARPGKTGAAFGPAPGSPETGSSCVRAFARPGKTGAAFGPVPGSLIGRKGRHPPRTAVRIRSGPNRAASVKGAAQAGNSAGAAGCGRSPHRRTASLRVLRQLRPRTGAVCGNAGRGRTPRTRTVSSRRSLRVRR